MDRGKKRVCCMRAQETPDKWAPRPGGVKEPGGQALYNNQLVLTPPTVGLSAQNLRASLVWALRHGGMICHIFLMSS